MVVWLDPMCHRLVVDVLERLLDDPRARGAFLLRAEMDPPWGIRVEDEAPLTVLVVARGTAVLHADTPVPLAAGDVALVRGPAPYAVTDADSSEPDIRVLPGQGCHDPDGRLLDEEMAQGVRTWGNARHGATSMLIGTYLAESEVGRRLLSALPRAAVLRSHEWRSPLAAALAEEVPRDEPGQTAVLDRLLDLVLVTAVRSLFARDGGPQWYAAQADPVVGRALRLIHHEPAHPWSVSALALQVGLSRAAFSRRFTDLVGEPPMGYLTRWRLDLAADLLTEPDTTLDSVARQVGYGTGFALSAAFKRVRGVSPADYRRSLLRSA